MSHSKAVRMQYRHYLLSCCFAMLLLVLVGLVEQSVFVVKVFASAFARQGGTVV